MSRAVHNRNRSGGFTLIEILGVIVILGLVSAVVVPQIGGRDDLKAAAAARTVMSDLLYAQNRAIATQKIQYVQFDATSGNYKVIDAWGPTHLITHPITGVNFQETFGASSTSGLNQMQLTSAAFDGTSVLAFDALGIPYSYNASTSALTALASGTIVVRSGNYQMTVKVAPYSGELTVQ